MAIEFLLHIKVSSLETSPLGSAYIEEYDYKKKEKIISSI